MFELDFGGATTIFRFDKLSTLGDHFDGSLSLAVCDTNTRSYVPSFVGGTRVLPSGETHKVWSSIDAILKDALELGMARDDIVLGIGGGVVCDMAAFAASIYMRGCRSILAPTTLLSMIDASFGGKTGIDFMSAKNLVGSFYPAEMVVIDLAALDTLPVREFASGLAEGIKHAMLGDPELFDLFEERKDDVLRGDRELVERIVEGSIRVKGKVVESDFKESGLRRHLNLGHTFAHALESATGFQSIKHGEAVAWGIGRALKTGVALGVTRPSYAGRTWRLLDQYGFALAGIEYEIDAIIECMQADKKRSHGELNFVLQRGLGDTFVTSVDQRLIREILGDDSPLE